MSKKLILGLIFGVAAGTAAAFLIKFRNKNKSFLEISMILFSPGMRRLKDILQLKNSSNPLGTNT